MKQFFIFFFLITFSSSFGQKMTTTKLEAIIKQVSDTVVSNNTRWNFVINEVPLVAIADSTHNRMRIISPVMEASQLTEELKTASLIANFHTALDIKYAITNNVLWSAYIHPLKELSEEQVIDAISQVYYGNVNFGTTFSTSSLTFPGRAPQQNTEDSKEKNEEQLKLLEKI